MSTIERTARDALKPYVKDGSITQSEVNKLIRDGLTLTEQTVRDNYSPDQTLYYAGEIVKAREQHETATGLTARRMRRSRLLAREMLAAVYTAVRAEHDDAEEMPMDQAVDVMTMVRRTARQVLEEETEDTPQPDPRPTA